MTRRLCMVVHGPYPIGEPRVARQSNAARDAGYEVDVVAMRRNGDPRSEIVEGVRVLRLPLEHRRGGGAIRMLCEYVGFTMLATMRVALLTVRRRYSVVQIHNPPDFLIVAAIVPRLLGARIVLDVHDLAPDMFAARFRGGRAGAVADTVLRRVEKLAVRLAHRVITVHDPYRQELVARSAPPSKVTVVMNSFDESLLPEPQREPDPGASAGDFRILYHGTVNPWYGVELIVEALAHILPAVPRARLDILGEGDALPAVRRRAAELGIVDRVTIPGRYLPQPEVLALARGASVGVVPNLPTKLNRFALSSKLFEYVALGIPVVSADLETIRAHFDDAEVRFFRAGDAESLAEALLAVAKDPSAARARAEAAIARYEEYRWARQAERYVALLGEDLPLATAVSTGSAEAV